MDYEINGLRWIKISELQSDYIRDLEHEDQQNLEELGNSIKEFSMINPLVVREHNGKYVIVDGNRRYNRLKNAGIKDKIPVIVSNMSGSDVKQAALISNQMRLGMHREDVAKTLVDIYADHGFKDIERVANDLKICGAQRSPKSSTHIDRRVIDPPFEKLARSIGMGVHAQRRYLMEYTHLHPQTKEITYKYDNQEKALLLTSPEIRKDKKLQVESAEAIKEMNIHDSRQTISKIKSGTPVLQAKYEVKKKDVPEYKSPPPSPKKPSGSKGEGNKATQSNQSYEGSLGVDISKDGVKELQKPKTDEEDNVLEGSFWIHGGESANKLIRILTGGKRNQATPDLTQETIDNSRAYRLKVMKLVHPLLMDRFQNTMTFLCERLWPDIKSMLIEERLVAGKKEETYGR